MARLKQHIARWPLALVILLAAGGAFGLARSVWDPYLFPARQAAASASCQNNLKQMGLVFKMFSDPKPYYYPMLSSEPGNLMFQWDTVYSEYLKDRKVMVCPGPKGEVPANVFTDKYYVYTGYLVRNDEDLGSFVAAYTAELADGADFSGNLPGATSYGNTVLRLREGIERFLITDINNASGLSQAKSSIPVMWEWPDNHQQGFGGNVLYMDGHVEWIGYPGKFPMTEHAFTTLASVAGYTPPTEWAGQVVETPNVGLTTLLASCQNNLKHVGLVNMMYANESQGGKFPPLSSTRGKLMMDPAAVYPDFAWDESIYLCPGRIEEDPAPFFDDDHYAYLGYMLANDSDVLQFATTYQQVIASGGNFSNDLAVPSSYGASIMRIREGVERFLPNQQATDPTQDVPTAASIVVMFEWPENHEWNSGGNVLYMDGHVEWVPYPGKFPMTETTIATLRALAQNTPATTWADQNPGPHDKYGYISPCSSNLKQWGLVTEMYLQESSGLVYPHLSATRGELIFRESEIYSEYISDFDFVHCPGVAENAPATQLDSRDYAYLGYLLPTEADVLAFVNAYAASSTVPEGDLNVPSSYGSKILRLCEGIERFTVTDINSPGLARQAAAAIPVMIEWPGNHETLAGGHVLYLDGHVEWHDYPGEFPMTENVINALGSIANRSPATTWSVPRFLGPLDQYVYGFCRSNERTFGIALKIYANISKDQYFPPLSSEPGLLMTGDDRFLRFQLGDIRRLNCPASTTAYRQPEIHDENYIYLGYGIPDQPTLERFATAYRQQIAAGGDFTGDLLTGADKVKRLREGIERFVITDYNSPIDPAYSEKKLPVLIEWPDNHVGVRGGNVLYMDGHTEWIDYPGKFPMTEEAIAVLTDLAGRGPIRAVEAIQEGPSRLERLMSLVGITSRR